MTSVTSSTLEWLVLGASLITCLYHFVLYWQQRDGFLLYYANYLLALAAYLFFRRITGYETFTATAPAKAFWFDYPLILYMLFSYVLFITRVLELNRETRIAKLSADLFYVTTAVLLVLHGYKIFFTTEFVLTRTYFFYSKLIMTFFAFTGLIGAWYIRKNTFKRIIIAGGLVFSFLSLLTMISVYWEVNLLGLKEYQLYFLGCLLDILIFSSALGYRNYTMMQEKLKVQDSLRKESERNQLLLMQQTELLKKENRQQQVQMQMNKQLQDEVGAGLSSLHVYADMAASLVRTNPERSKAYLERVASQSQQMMDDIGDIIWLANLNMEQAHEQFIARIKNYGQEIIQDETKHCTYQVQRYFHGALLSKEFMKETLMRVKQHMQMCAKELKAGHLTIVFDAHYQTPVVTIQ